MKDLSPRQFEWFRLSKALAVELFSLEKKYLDSS